VYSRLPDAPAGRLYGIPRGGAIVAGLTGRAVDRIEDADWVVDDVIDSGATADGAAGGKPIWGLFDVAQEGIGDQELVLPWEALAPNDRRGKLERLGHELLEVLGYDPSMSGLKQTPRRWAGWWEEFLNYRPGTTDTTFAESVTGQMVAVSGIRTWSVCEHHLLPFEVSISVGYLPSTRVLGLSKFVRLAHATAHRLQLQERLVEQLADLLRDVVHSDDVVVMAHGRHTCLEARGVRTAAAVTSIAGRGRFLSDSKVRREFILLVGAGIRSE
jgi:GTP cyclohydrolase I